MNFTVSAFVVLNFAREFFYISQSVRGKIVDTVFNSLGTNLVGVNYQISKIIERYRSTRIFHVYYLYD